MAATAASQYVLDERKRSPRHRLLTTKLYPPRLHPTLVARPRIFATLSDDQQIAIVCAPAGYGKSVLVGQWLMGEGHPLAWMSLDSGDNDPWCFFSLMTTALQSIHPQVADHTRALLDGGGAPSTTTFVRSLLEELSETTRRFALVLDDYHAIENPEIHVAVGGLLQYLPATMRFVIISRADPPLPLSRLRARREVVELGPNDLRFSNEEAVELLLRSNSLELTPGEATTLNERAEGWVVGLQLAAHAMRHHPPEQIHRFTAEFSGSVRSIENYLLEEVLSTEPAAIQTFLLRTSILDRFDAALCDAVTMGGASAVAIRHLERNNRFLVPLDDLGLWHRYHHLFADMLRDHLAATTTEQELDQLHRRAAGWLSDQGLLEEAARHAIACRDWDLTVTLLEQVGAELYERDRIPALSHWLQLLPLDVLERSPKLAFWLAWALARTGRIHEADHLIRISEQAWTATGDRAGLGSVRMLQAFQFGDAHETSRAINSLREALDLLPDDQPGEQAVVWMLLGGAHAVEGNLADAEHALTNARVKNELAQHERVWLAEMAGSGAVLVQRGKLREAAVQFRRVIKRADERFSIQVQQARLRLGLVYLEWNMLDDAEQMLRYVDLLSEETQSLYWRSRICLGLARLAWARCEFDAAIDEVDRAVEYAIQSGSLSEVRHTKAQHARFWVASGQTALARQWADSCEFDPARPPVYERQFEHLTFVRLLIADGAPAEAHRILTNICDRTEASGRMGDLVEILVLKSLAEKAIGDHATAMGTMDQALARGESGGYVRVFVDEAAENVALLRHSSTRGAHRDYAQRLLAVIDSAEPSPMPIQTDSLNALSEREIEVLRMVAAGLGNRDIGQLLFISEKTVKKHMSHILGKLQSVNRTQAVDQARRAGLLES